MGPSEGVSYKGMMAPRKDELWDLIIRKKGATPEQLREWCKELTSMPCICKRCSRQCVCDETYRDDGETHCEQCHFDVCIEEKEGRRNPDTK